MTTRELLHKDLEYLYFEKGATIVKCKTSFRVTYSEVRTILYNLTKRDDVALKYGTQWRFREMKKEPTKIYNPERMPYKNISNADIRRLFPNNEMDYGSFALPKHGFWESDEVVGMK